jgi:hypothetical protein
MTSPGNCTHCGRKLVNGLCIECDTVGGGQEEVRGTSRAMNPDLYTPYTLPGPLEAHEIPSWRRRFGWRVGHPHEYCMDELPVIILAPNPVL